MFDSQKKIVSKVVLMIWIVFSVFYVLKGEYDRLQNFVAKSAYDRGVTAAATQIIEQSKECKPLPVAVGENKVELINIECLKTPQEENKTDENSQEAN